MQNFVKREHASSPQDAQNKQRINPNRQAIGANAKVTVKSKRPPTTQEPQQDQPKSGIPSRGLSHAQNISAAIQQAPRRRQSGQGLKQDPFDTDTGSIDTTVNQSVNQVEHSQRKDPQHQQHPGHSEVEDLGEASDEDEEAFDDEEGCEEDYDDYAFTQEDVQLLQEARLDHLPRHEAVAFLQQARSHAFRTVDGDSYPTTTEGDPDEWEGAQEPPSEDFDGGGPVSPSPQHPTTNGQRSVAPQPPQPRTFDQGRNHNMQKPADMFRQSAHIRNQQRLNTHPVPGPGQGHQNNPVYLPSSQSPFYSQANYVAPAPPLNHVPRQNNHVNFNKPQQHASRQPSGPARVTVQPLKPSEAPAPTKCPAPVRPEIVPIIQKSPVDQTLIEEANAGLNGDYDLEALLAMNYNDLKNEGFDTSPCAPNQHLAEDMLHKPLVERLDFARKNLKADQQSDFFRSLPTAEWEDAGDWFLEQFNSIISRTKDARQKKRKLAQEFEYEVEKRHKYVAKKQCQVEDAMSKMKAQGEGLVPKSPRASKSPKPRRE